jgi:hypothetical protein
MMKREGDEVTCHLEWDLLAGPTCLTTPTLTLEYPTRYGRGGVDGGEVEAEVAGLAGGLLPIGMPGGKAGNKICVRR